MAAAAIAAAGDSRVVVIVLALATAARRERSVEPAAMAERSGFCEKNGYLITRFLPLNGSMVIKYH